jgi:hypothetical protein
VSYFILSPLDKAHYFAYNTLRNKKTVVTKKRTEKTMTTNENSNIIALAAIPAGIDHPFEDSTVEILKVEKYNGVPLAHVRIVDSSMQAWLSIEYPIVGYFNWCDTVCVPCVKKHNVDVTIPDNLPFSTKYSTFTLGDAIRDQGYTCVYCGQDFPQNLPTLEPTAFYSVLVGNIGYVLQSSPDKALAQGFFDVYVKRSKLGLGAAANEAVTLFESIGHGDEPIAEYEPEPEIDESDLVECKCGWVGLFDDTHECTLYEDDPQEWDDILNGFSTGYVED